MSKKLSLRFRVFQRDNFKCVYCGASHQISQLEVDHKIPKSKGGSDDLDNLVTSCFNCNRGKRDRLITDSPVSKSPKSKQVLESDKEYWARRKRIETTDSPHQPTSSKTYKDYFDHDISKHAVKIQSCSYCGKTLLNDKDKRAGYHPTCEEIERRESRKRNLGKPGIFAKYFEE